MTKLGFKYEIHTESGENILVQNISGAPMGVMLEHITKVLYEQRKQHGPVVLNMVEARLEDGKILIDKKRMESLNTLVALAAEHYHKKAGKLIVETQVIKKAGLAENLKKVLSNPKKIKKLMTELKFNEEIQRHPDADVMGKVATNFGYKQHLRNPDGYTHISGNRIVIEPKGWMHQAGGKVKYGTTTDALQKHLTKLHGKPLHELDLPSLDKGDVLLVGKFKNRKAEIKGFTTDEHGQPVAQTTKGEQKIFKARIAKLMPEPQTESETPRKTTHVVTNQHGIKTPVHVDNKGKVFITKGGLDSGSTGKTKSELEKMGHKFDAMKEAEVMDKKGKKTKQLFQHHPEAP